ncbi:tubulin-like doman-containing protein [Pleurocapsa sp. PCC 7319]|uniref:tubulin-like doman-containing protein n=1 Tax=Pleurocapsa sp. PCC 7319 TaxID=118161 RepID=UPI00034C1BFB|nr:tubulin-like doman-containing protein [Pleurocapsa sp. PCC 7319]
MNIKPEAQSQKIRRTICIGLGGTGKDVLMRIRRLIVDKYSNLDALPVVSFVHIDTDKASSNVTGLRTGNFYHGVDLRLSDAEKVASTMSRVEVNNFVQEMNRKSSNYEGSPGVYKNIECWFPPQLLKDLKAIDEGAKGIRPVGRLAFFHNHRKIRNALQTAEQRTRGHESKLIQQGLVVDNELSIFLVGSLCGGTGSGIFLDTAYCLRGMYGDRGAQISGYLVISPELYGDTPSMNANAYAALKELNYYATAGTNFKAYYDLQNLQYVEESRPPFEYVYLVSNRTKSDYRILEKSKLCNIIAHKIYLDFAGELSPMLVAQRDNFLQHLIQLDEHPRPNVQRYLTFGLAEIYFPRDIAVQVSLNRIKLKLVKYWLQGEGQSPDAKILLERFLNQWYSGGDKQEGLINKLRQTTTDGNKTFSNVLSSWRNRLENSIAECETKDDRENLITQLSREIREQFRKVQPGESDSNRGVWLTNIKQARERITRELTKDIDRFLVTLLHPSQPDFSLANSRAWLEALSTELNQTYRNTEDRVNSNGKIHSLEEVERKWQDAAQTIEDLESKRGLLPFNKKQKKSQVQEEAKRIVGEVNKLIKHNFDFVLTRETLEIVKSLQHYVNDLTTKASNFYNLLKNIQLAYEKTETELKQLNVDEMSGEAIFADADTDDCYQSLLPDRDRATQLALVTTKITEKIGLGESLASCLDAGLIDEPQLIEEINLIVDGLFGSRSLDRVQSATKRFLENYSVSDRATRLEQILREAEPLLPLNTSDPYFYNDSGKSAEIIGFKDTDNREVIQFKQILFNDLGVPDSQLKPIQAEDEIVFVTEYAAFPLRLIQDLAQMRQHYLRQKTYGSGFLHNDYRTMFTDILPPDAREMKQLQDIFYPSLAFGLLPCNQQTGLHELQYYDRLRDTYQVNTISTVWDEALEQLANVKDMAVALNQELDKAIDDITNNPNKWESHYLPKLREFVALVDELPEDDPNYLYKEIVVGTRETLDTKAQEGIINRFWRRMEEKFNQQQALSSSSLPSQSQQRLSGTTTAVINNSQKSTKITESEANQNEVLDAEIDNDNSSKNNPEIIAKLAQLKQLRDQGIITEEGFKAKEKEILDLYF